MENETTEFKLEYTENIYKEIIAFLNSYSGTIFIEYNDDCYNEITSISDNSIDLVIIDSPYNINTRKNRVGYNRITESIIKVENNLANHNLTENYDFFLLNGLIRIMKKINIYIWCSKSQIEDYLKYFIDKHKCRYEILILNKTNTMSLYSNKYINDKEYCLYFRKESKCILATYDDARTVYISPSNARIEKILEKKELRK